MHFRGDIRKILGIRRHQERDRGKPKADSRYFGTPFSKKRTRSIAIDRPNSRPESIYSKINQ